VGGQCEAESCEFHSAADAAHGDPVIIIEGIIEFIRMTRERTACRPRRDRCFRESAICACDSWAAQSLVLVPLSGGVELNLMACALVHVMTLVTELVCKCHLCFLGYGDLAVKMHNQ